VAYVELFFFYIPKRDTNMTYKYLIERERDFRYGQFVLENKNEKRTSIIRFRYRKQFIMKTFAKEKQ